MHKYAINSLRRGVAVLGFATFLGLSVSSSQSQTLETILGLSAGNRTANGQGYYATYTSVNYTPSGGAITSSGHQGFSGKDSHGVTQNMAYSGAQTGQSDYGSLHASSTLSVTNPYHNASNPIYYNDVTARNDSGSPDVLISLAQTHWTDTININPLRDGIVSTVYYFHIDGVQGAYSSANLAFTSGLDSTSFGTPYKSASSISANWVTPTWNATSRLQISGYFQAVSTLYLDQNIYSEGQSISSSASFDNTLTLTSIQFLNANGAQVNGAYFTSDSGTHYNVLGGIYGVAPSSSAVPEPGAVALLVCSGVFGGAMFLKRRPKSSITLG